MNKYIIKARIIDFLKNHQAAVFFLSSFIIFYGLYQNYEKEFYRELIPPQIKTSGTLVIDGEFHLFSGCGVASFWLNDETIEEIKQKGISFFENATKAKRRKDGVFYEKWEPTPMPKETFSDGTWPAFQCTGSLSNRWKDRIYYAAQEPGSYYTSELGVSQLLVLPNLGIVILIYYN